ALRARAARAADLAVDPRRRVRAAAEAGAELDRAHRLDRARARGTVRRGHRHRGQGAARLAARVTDGDDHDAVAADIARVLVLRRLEATRSRPSWWLSGPAKVLQKLGGKALRGYMPEHLAFWREGARRLDPRAPRRVAGARTGPADFRRRGAGPADAAA